MRFHAASFSFALTFYHFKPLLQIPINSFNLPPRLLSAGSFQFTFHTFLLCLKNLVNSNHKIVQRMCNLWMLKWPSYRLKQIERVLVYSFPPNNLFTNQKLSSKHVDKSSKQFSIEFKIFSKQFMCFLVRKISVWPCRFYSLFEIQWHKFSQFTCRQIKRKSFLLFPSIFLGLAWLSSKK